MCDVPFSLMQQLISKIDLEIDFCEISQMSFSSEVISHEDLRLLGSSPERAASETCTVHGS